MKRFSLPSALSLLVCAQIATGLVINTPCGDLEGDVSPNAASVYRFLGVSFAETPVRFEKAEQKISWQGTRNATYYRDACLQINPFGGVPFGSEDCLTLDVYTPVNLSNVDVNDPTNQIPVMVWIHGGGFALGSSNLYEGSKLAHVGEVVVVAIQYRLGAFGWLYSNGVKPSNLGLWDQKLALEWIQRNIYAFGGDNSTVTVFGESAGAMSISALITSPLVDNSLFQRVIMQSGSVMNGNPRQHLKELAIQSSYGLCPKESLDERMTCLQTLDANEIAQNMSMIVFAPVPDNQYIMESASKVLRDFATGGIDSIQDVIGNMGQYDILNGFNGQEGFLILQFLQIRLGLALDEGISDEMYHSIVVSQIAGITVNQPMSTQQIASYLQANYNVRLTEDRSEEDNNMNNLLNLLGDFAMAIPTINTATIHSEVVRLTNTQKKTYMYLFDHKPANGSDLIAGPEWLQTSASHTDDLRFLLSSSNPRMKKYLTPEEENLSEIMLQYWTNFAKTGNPNSGSNQKWKEYTKETTNFVRFTLDDVTEEVMPRGDKPQVWDCVYKAVYDNKPNLCMIPSTTTTEDPNCAALMATQCSVTIAAAILSILFTFSW